jgi:hypothetical protein
MADLGEIDIFSPEERLQGIEFNSRKKPPYPEGEDPTAYRWTGEEWVRKSQTGFLGPRIHKSTGATMTEFSIGNTEDPLDPDDPLRPSMVPTLTEEEIGFLTTLPEGVSPREWGKHPLGRSILEKSWDHYKMRVGQGLSPFLTHDEESPRHTVQQFQYGGAVDDTDIFSPEERLQYGLAELPQQSDFNMLDYLPSGAQLGWFGSQFAPGAGVVDASGGMPGMPTGEQSAFAAENMPSMAENIDRGGWGYLDAGLQGLGVLGDAMYGVPALGLVLGPTAGSILKGAGATGKAIRRGIASLRRPESVVDPGAGLKADAPMASAAQAPQQLIDVGGKPLSRFFTEPEIAKLKNTQSAASFMALMKAIPNAREMATVAEAGMAKRGWYQASAHALQNVFGQDAPRFAGVLASTSPQTKVQDNLLNASNIFKNWNAAGRPSDPRLFNIINEPGVAGALMLKKARGGEMVRILEEEARRIFIAAGGDDGLFDLGRMQLQILGDSVQGTKGIDSVLDAWVGNTIRSLNVPDSQMSDLVLSGPKVDSFMRNLVGNTVEVTNDTWIANYLGIPQTAFSGSLNPARIDPGKRPGYIAANVLTRNAADILSNRLGERVTGPEIQEMVWSWAKAVSERARSQGMSPVAFIKDGRLTDSMINDTPDFSRLLNDPDLPYRNILQDDFNISAPLPSRVLEGNVTEEIMSRSDTLRRDLQRAAGRLQRIKGDQAALAAVAPLIVLSMTQQEKENQEPAELFGGGPVAVKKYQNGGPVDSIDIFADGQESPEAQTISQLVFDGRMREAYAEFEKLPFAQQLAISVAPGIGDALAAYEVGEFGARARESMKSGSPLGAAGNLAMSGLAGLSFIPMLRTLRVGRPLGKAVASTSEAIPTPAVASTSEAIPGSSTGQLTGVTDLPADVRYQYSRDVYTDPNTGQMYQRDPFYEAMDMPQRDVFEGHGYYQGEFNPTFVSRPVPRTIPDAQGIPRIDPSDAKTIEQRDTTFGYLTQQEGTPTSRVLEAMPAGTLDTIKITTDKSITQNQFKEIAEYAKQYDLDQISLPDGITFVNNKSFDVLEDLSPEIGNDLSRFISQTIGDPDMLKARGNFDTINYSSFADEFAEGAGELAGTSGAATRKLFQSLDDETIKQLDNSADVRRFVENKLEVDLKIANEKNLPMRRDIRTALTIISDQGFSGLKRVMEKGEVILPGILFLYLGRAIPMVLGETQPSEV